jgi:hypothetical protein
MGIVRPFIIDPKIAGNTKILGEFNGQTFEKAPIF